MTRLLFSLASVLLLTGSTAAGPPQTPDELLAAIQKGQERLAEAERAVTGYQCQYDLTAPAIPKADETHTTLRVTRRGDSVMLDSERGPSAREPNKRRELVKLCMHDDHMFGIMQPAGTSSWALVQFTRTDREAQFSESLSLFRPALFPLRAVNPVGVSDEHVNNPTFRIRSMKTRPGELVDAEIVVDGIGENKVTVEGTMTVSPRHDYAITEYKYTLSNDKILRYHMTRVLSETPGPIRCPSFRFLMINSATGAVQHKQEIRFTDYTSEPVDKAIFTLEHYGIPTPTDDLVPVYSRWKFWFILAAAGVGLALLFRWLARRRSSSQ